MIKIKRVRPINKTASPMWCETTVVVDKQGKRKQEQVWYSLENKPCHIKEEICTE